MNAPPAFGEVAEIAPAVHWTRMPLPYAAGHVNIWLLDEGDAWTVVDCGIDSYEAAGDWRSLLAGAMGGKPVRLLVGTHGHNDHVGFAGPFCRMTGAPLAMPRAEWLTAMFRKGETVEAQLPAARDFYGANGWPEDEYLRALEQRVRVMDRLAPLPRSYRRIRDGQTLGFGGHEWHVTTSGGHSPEHPIFHAVDAPFMIAGDHLLSHNAPPIGVHMHEPDENPLGEFLNLLAALESVPDEVLVLPSHGVPYHGLARRIGEIRAHIDKRREQVLEAASTPRTAYEICRSVFHRSVARGNMTIAFSQTLSQINLLRAQGCIFAQMRGGIVHYAATAAALKPSPPDAFGSVDTEASCG